MKTKEKEFAQRLLQICKNEPYKANIAFEFSDNKQLMYYLEKWTGNNWWEYGVSLRSGWFTPEGIKYFKTK